MFGDLQELCDSIGGRPTGLPAASKAIQWAASKFHDAGLNPRLEPFDVPYLSNNRGLAGTR